jgi:hypothetical protein
MYRQQRNYENLTKAIFEGEGLYNIPVLKKDTISADTFIGFNYAKSCKDPAEKGLHFFVDDYQFLRVWTNPDALYTDVDEVQSGMYPRFFALYRLPACYPDL